MTTPQWTKAEVLEKLLALGDLMLEELLCITGWDRQLLLGTLREATTTGRVRRHLCGARWFYRLLKPGEDHRPNTGTINAAWNPARRQEADYRRQERDDLRRLRTCQLRPRAPAGVEPLQPGVPDLRGQDDLLHPPHEDAIGGAARGAYEQGRDRLGAVRARREGTAHPGETLVERMGDMGQ